MKVIVTGGSGYVGYHIGWAIACGGHDVILLDLRLPDPEWQVTAPKALYDALPEGFWKEDEQGNGSLQFVKANITSYSCLRRVFQGATAVIHTASYGISGQEQLNAHMSQQEEINVGGTRNVIRAAVDAKVQALVYTSTYNVVFGGTPILEGDESLPLFSLHAHSDNYSRTKTIAEMLVLTASGKCLSVDEPTYCSKEPIEYVTLPLHSESPVTTSAKESDTLIPSHSDKGSLSTQLLTLRTCSLRLAGVMGLGERRHSCRVIDALRSGFHCVYGNRENRVEFIGIQNVVQAHIKAMMALIQEQNGTSNRKPDVTELLPEKSNLSQDTKDYTAYNSMKTIMSTEEDDETSDKVSGNAFFVSDESPINHFEYFRPWYEGLGYGFPTIRLPLALIMIVAHLQQAVYSAVHKVFPFKPFITPAEVYKSGVTHYFSCGKARRCFGYKPTRPNDQSQIVEYYKRKGFVKDQNESSFILRLHFCIGLVFLFGILVYLLFM